MPASKDNRRTFTPPEVARDRWRVSPDKVIGFIEAGELEAINVAQKLGGRPRYRISLEAILQFEQRRSASPPPKAAPKNRRRSLNSIDFF